jgi:hypothetical protein
VRQILPSYGYWPLLLAMLGPLAGRIYLNKARRQETLELKLLPPQGFIPTTLKLRAHRDELIALERSLGRSLNLHSDGKLLSSPL